MTIIAYKNGIMAADSAVWTGYIYGGEITKIIKTPNGSLVGASGNHAICSKFRAWALLENEETPWEGGDSFYGVIVKKDGTIMMYYDKNGIGEICYEDSHAIGCGYEIALGAMDAGATAIRAVEIAIKRHAYCSGKIVILKLEGNTQ
jgi:ATP-dependent HslUV protease subunit HslV